jgi:tRNA-dihydrouridine synthase 4
MLRKKIKFKFIITVIKPLKELKKMTENLFELFDRKKSENDFVKICAPMVRYSKLSFRRLVRKNGCDLAFTPMILADTFVASAKARDVEFTSCPSDRPLVVQFAASKVS